jgi:hypothetical protein
VATETVPEDLTGHLGLPRGVLEKFYHRNAQRLYPLEAAWPGAK